MIDNSFMYNVIANFNLNLVINVYNHFSSENVKLFSSIGALKMSLNGFELMIVIHA